MEQSNLLNPEKLKRNLNLIKNLNVDNLSRFIVLGQDDSDPNQLDLLLLTKNRHVLAFGPNVQGRLGVGHCNPVQERAIEISELKKLEFVDFVCGGRQVLALTKNGRIFAWGDNQHGKLGLGLSEEKVLQPTLVQPKDVKFVKSIKCGLKHSLALDESGQVYQWGDCGNKKFSVPTIVSELKDETVTEIECGESHSIALTKDGLVYTWGNNEWGQLGIGHQFKYKFEPFLVKIVNDFYINSIAAGNFHSIFLTPHGNVFACGRNDSGQVSCNLTEDRLFELQDINRTKNVKSIKDKHNLFDSSSSHDIDFLDFELCSQTTHKTYDKMDKDFKIIQQGMIMFNSFKSATKLVNFQNMHNQKSASISKPSSSFSSSSIFFHSDESFEKLFYKSLELSRSKNFLSNIQKYRGGLKSTELLIPLTFKDATKTNFENRHWSDAIGDELVTLLQHNVIGKELLTEDDLIDTATKLKCRCLFGVLDDQDDHIDRFVAQFVIDDTEDTSSQLSNKLIHSNIIFPTTQMLLVWALKKSLSIRKVFIQTTFKNCSMINDGYPSSCDIYLQMPVNRYCIFKNCSMINDGYPSNLDINLQMPVNWYCRLLKPLHKLTTLSKNSRSDSFFYQNQFINNILLNSGQFVQCTPDDFMYRSKCGQIYLIVYFNEMLVIGDSHDLVIDLLTDNSVWFDDCGEITDDKSQTFCSVTIERSDNKLKLNQQDLIEHMEKHFDLADNIQDNNCNPLNEFNLPDKGNPNLDLPTCSQLIGMLSVVATRTRPDLMSSVHFLALNRQNPYEDLWENAIKILEYLVKNKTKKHCLDINFLEDNSDWLTIWTDASFGCDTTNKSINHDGRCVSGVVAMWHGCAILWQSLKQWMVSLMVVDAKLYSMYYGVNSGLALAIRIEQFENPDKKQNKKFKLLNDNTCAIDLVTNGLTDEYKRLNIEMYGPVKREYENGHFEIEYVKNDDNLADCMTKPINAANKTMARIMNQCIESKN